MSIINAGPKVEIANLSKGWGGARAVNDMSLSFAAGAFTAVLGPSGCGKSTLLRLLAGLEVPDAGTIRIGEKDVTAAPPAARGIAMVFQNYALFPHLDVAENITFGLKVRKASRNDIRQKLEEAAELLNLGPHLAKRPSQLSGGQQQRVALARAIVGGRSVFLMDEPLSNLDAKLRADMRRELRELQQSLGVTVIYVTHDQLEAVTMADKVLLLNGGHVEQYDQPRQIYSHPETLFAATFIGTPQMNMLPAALIAPPAADGLGDTLAGLRAESIVLGPNAPHEAQVTNKEFHGADAMLTLMIGGHVLFARVPAAEADRVGNSVRFGFDMDSLHLFDAISGRRADTRLRHFRPQLVSS